MAREENISEERPEESIPYQKEGSGLREQLSEQLRQRPEYEEYLRLLADKDLWALMLIPFSPELVKLADLIITPTAATAVAQAVYVSGAVEAELKSTKDMVIIHEAIARTLGIAPSEITQKDYENVISLDLSDSSIVDLKLIANLRNLKQLYLTRCKNVTDISPLKALTSLQLISLTGTQVIDLKHLKGLNRLQWLYLRRTQVSDEEVSMLQQVLPNLAIIR